MTRTKSQKLRAAQRRLSQQNGNSQRRRQNNAQRNSNNSGTLNMPVQRPRRQRGSNRGNQSQRQVGIASSQHPSTYFKASGYGAQGHLRIQGQDFLSPISLVEGATAGQNILSLPINPANLTGTRLERFCELFDKFVFKSLRFHYVPAVPTTAAGSLIMAYDRDVKDTTPSQDTQGIREYLAMMNSKTGQIWEKFTINCPLSDTQDFYYVDGGDLDDRLANQGKFYLAVMTPLNSTSVGSGSIWMEYDIVLMDPQLSSVATTEDFKWYNLTIGDSDSVSISSGENEFFTWFDSSTNRVYVANEGDGITYEPSTPVGPVQGRFNFPAGYYLGSLQWGSIVPPAGADPASLSLEAKNSSESLLAVLTNLVQLKGMQDGFVAQVFLMKVPPGGAYLYGTHEDAGLFVQTSASLGNIVLEANITEIPEPAYDSLVANTVWTSLIDLSLKLKAKKGNNNADSARNSPSLQRR